MQPLLSSVDLSRVGDEGPEVASTRVLPIVATGHGHAAPVVVITGPVLVARSEAKPLERPTRLAA